MTQADERVPEANETAREWVRRPMPRAFTKTAWRRFNRDRRRAYLADLPALPTIEQLARIESLVRHEWHALRAEAVGTLAADTSAREHRRLLNRLLADHTRALQPGMAQQRRRAPRLVDIVSRAR
jgi:hypothetical protein